MFEKEKVQERRFLRDDRRLDNEHVRKRRTRYYEEVYKKCLHHNSLFWF